MTTPPNTPPAPTIPLTSGLRTAYQDLYKTYEAAIESTTNVEALEALNASQLDVDSILTMDGEYRLAANTALYGTLLQQINSTNVNLKALQAQILDISTDVSTFGDILGAIDKVLTLIPGA